VRLGDPTFTRASSAAHLGKANGGATPQYGGPNFVLMVSSFDIRKNQKFQLPIWSRLIRELGREATPDLLLIGKNGNRSSEFQSLLDNSPELKVVVLNSVQDNELAWYCQKALFTVFPSLAEGWASRWRRACHLEKFVFRRMLIPFRRSAEISFPISR